MAKSPKVWTRFLVTKDTGTKIFKIVDLPLERVDEFADFKIKYYINEEPTYTASGVPKSKEALQEYKNRLTKRLKDGVFHAVVCCEDKGDDSVGDFAGSSVIFLKTKEDVIENRFQPTTKELQTLFEMCDTMDSKYKVMEIYNLDKYYDDRGLVVHPDYRGNGIAQELFKARRLISKEHGVPMTGSWMTARGSQIAAMRDGWETVCEINKQEIAQKCGVTFDKSSPAISLFMIAKV